MRYLLLTISLTLALSIGSAMGQSYSDYFNTGKRVPNLGDQDGIIIRDHPLLFMNPRNYDAIANRAYGKLLNHDLEGALADCNFAIAMAPTRAKAYNIRAGIKFNKGDTNGACDDLNNAISVAPKDPQAYQNLKMLKTRQGDLKGAAGECMILISLSQTNAMPYNDLAWIYATASDPSIRNGAKAIEYSTQACNLTQWKNPGILDTFAAACAEVGDFNQAVKWENKVVETYSTNKDIQARLALYQAHQPYHQAPPSVNPSGSPTPAPKS